MNQKQLNQMNERLEKRIGKFLLPNRASSEVEVRKRLRSSGVYHPKENGRKGRISIRETCLFSKDIEKTLAHEIVHDIQDDYFIGRGRKQATEGLAVFTVDHLFRKPRIFNEGYSNAPKIYREGFSKVQRVFRESGRHGLVYVLMNPFKDRENIDLYIEKIKLEINGGK